MMIMIMITRTIAGSPSGQVPLADLLGRGAAAVAAGGSGAAAEATNAGQIMFYHTET